MVVGGKEQPNLKIRANSKVALKLENGTSYTGTYPKGTEDAFFKDMIGYALAKFGKEELLSLVESWDSAKTGTLQSLVKGE
ncbi:hypothetical protein [Vibrio phage RYC]|nr:hypothetical protein [Vibrio phage RYC]